MGWVRDPKTGQWTQGDDPPGMDLGLGAAWDRRLTWLALALPAIIAGLFWLDSYSRRQPVSPPDPGPPAFLGVLAWVAGAIVALLALGALAWLARRFGPRLLGALRHDLAEAWVWWRERGQR